MSYPLIFSISILVLFHSILFYCPLLFKMLFIAHWFQHAIWKIWNWIIIKINQLMLSKYSSVSRMGACSKMWSGYLHFQETREVPQNSFAEVWAPERVWFITNLQILECLVSGGWSFVVTCFNSMSSRQYFQRRILITEIKQ